MKKILLLVFLFSLNINAQHSISGNFSPAKDYTWIVAYHLKPGTQNYIADTAVKDGHFILNVPANKPIGIYRLVYAVPQEEFYFDVIYNGKEDIKLDFNSSEGVSFTRSFENIPYSTYFKKINLAQTELIDFYTSGEKNIDTFNRIIAKLERIQRDAEKQTKQLIANQFIVANRPYIPKDFETIQHYVLNRKEKYFDKLDLKNTKLQASGLLTDKLMNYVFTALPLEGMDGEETEKFMQQNVNTIAEKLDGIDENYRFSVFNTLWSQASASKLNDVSDFTYTTYLKDLALKTDNAQTVLDVETHNRLRLNAVAPELEWQENSANKTLSTWEGGEQYLLIFWSSTCGHCLKELPALHKELRKNGTVKVLAIGLEDNDTYWNIETAKLPNFSHTISLGKWDSAYADLYNIQSTPSYFILDKEKRIIAKPESDKDVVDFLEK